MANDLVDRASGGAVKPAKKPKAPSLDPLDYLGMPGSIVRAQRGDLSVPPDIGAIGLAGVSGAASAPPPPAPDLIAAQAGLARIPAEAARIAIEQHAQGKPFAPSQVPTPAANPAPAPSGPNPLQILAGLSQATVNDAANRPPAPAPAAKPAPQYPARDPVKDQARAIDFAERQGRVNVAAMADRIMRQAHLNGQSMPMAQAYAIAMGQAKTTDPMQGGAVPSLPGMDPQRMAGFMGPAAGAAAGQYGVAMGQNANQATRDQLQSNLGQAQVAQQGANGNQSMAQQLIQILLGHSIAQQQQDTNAAVAQNAMGPTPAVQQQNAARQQLIQMLSSPNHDVMMSTNPQYAQVFQQVMTAAYPQASAMNAAGGQAVPAPPTPNPPASPLSSTFSGLPPANNTMAVNAYLNRIADPAQRALEQARIYGTQGVSHPSIGEHANSWFNQNSPNLADWWPDWGWLNDDAKLAQSAADKYAAATGIPAQAALPYFQQRFD